MRTLAAYRFPSEVSRRYPRFDAAAARAVLGGKAARLNARPIIASVGVDVRQRRMLITRC